MDSVCISCFLTQSRLTKTILFSNCLLPSWNDLVWLTWFLKPTLQLVLQCTMPARYRPASNSASLSIVVCQYAEQTCHDHRCNTPRKQKQRCCYVIFFETCFLKPVDHKGVYIQVRIKSNGFKVSSPVY